MRRGDRLRQIIPDRLPSGAAAGVALALLTAVISGFAIFINSYAVKHFDSPTVFTTLKNACVGAAFLALLLRPAALAEVRRLRPVQGAGLLVLAIIGGSVPFVLFFEGLTRVDAGNAAFLHKTLFIWVALLAVVLLRERLGRAQVGALGLLLAAQWLLGGPGSLRGEGVLMVFGAALLWSCEVVLARKMLGSMSGGLAASGRMTLGAALLLAWLGASGRLGEAAGLSASQLGWVLATSLILMAYVATWYAALKRAPATAVACVLTIGAPITAALDLLAGRPGPGGDDLLAYALLTMAALAIGLLSARGARAGAEPASALAAEGLG
jgi:drug/metabolite transporter (DMT)-like permease